MLSSDREMIFHVKDQSANQPKPSVMTFGFLRIHIFSEFMKLAQVTRSELHDKQHTNTVPFTGPFEED